MHDRNTTVSAVFLKPSIPNVPCLQQFPFFATGILYMSSSYCLSFAITNKQFADLNRFPRFRPPPLQQAISKRERRLHDPQIRYVLSRVVVNMSLKRRNFIVLFRFVTFRSTKC
jgi:hypothetical protein